MPTIEVRNVTKIFGPEPETVLARVRNGDSKEDILAGTGHAVGLNDVSLFVASGETFVVMGLSGSGKSTLIRHLNRLIDPTAGEILIDGEDVLSFDAKAMTAMRRERMSMVFQRFGLFPHRTVIDNVAYGLEIQGAKPADRRERAGEWIGTVGLDGYEDAYPSQLSGGMQQRVGLARALCTDPEILLMDEAFSALDPLIRSGMQRTLLDLQRDLGKTIVFITHDLDEALRLGDRIAILKDGALIQVGTPAEIILRPADDYVSAFVRDINRARVLTVGVAMEASVANGGGASAVSTALPIGASLEEALPTVLASDDPVPVVDESGEIAGLLSRAGLGRFLGNTVPRGPLQNSDTPA